MTSEVFSVHATADDAGARLDAFLARHLPRLSRSQIQRLIREGAVRVEGTKKPKPSLVVWDGLEADVSVAAPAPLDLQPEALPLSILHDDASVVVIDKPAGMVVHPAAGHRTGTVVHALLHHVGGLSGVGGRERPGIVHRLDRGTSGVMVIAKTDAAHRELTRQFHDREVEKEYLALVWGRVSTGTTIDRPIGRHPKQRQKMSTRAPRARTAPDQSRRSRVRRRSLLPARRDRHGPHASDSSAPRRRRAIRSRATSSTAACDGGCRRARHP